MITCQRAAEWTSREVDEPLPVGRRFALAVHRLLCPSCRRFRTQLVELDQAVGRFITDGTAASEGLTDDARQRIKEALANDTSG